MSLNKLWGKLTINNNTVQVALHDNDDTQKIATSLWLEHIQNRAGICQCCPKCGGNYSWKCQCAEERFRDRLTAADINTQRYKLLQK